MLSYVRGKKYDIFIDNIILFLEEIDRNKDAYTSIFDSPILKKYKDVHDLYGTCFTFCLFWQLDQGARGGSPSESEREIGWNLSRMTSKFKAEFEANTSWIRFNFHAWNYGTEYALSSRNLGEDYLLVKNEVIRFAGAGSWINFMTRVHSLSATAEQQQQLRDLGVNVLFFTSMHTNYNGYELTTEDRDTIYTQGVLYKPDRDILYVTACGRPHFITVNTPDIGVGKAMTMDDYFNEFVAGTNPNWYKSPLDYMSIVGHEYDLWQAPEVYQGYLDSAAWMQDNGYTPAYFSYAHISDLTYSFRTPVSGVNPVFSQAARSYTDPVFL